MVTVLRPLSTSELLDRAFYLYRNNFVVFVGIAAIPQLAVLALQLGSAALLFSGSVVGFSAGAVIAALVSYIAIEISQAATSWLSPISTWTAQRPLGALTRRRKEAWAG